MEDSNLHFTGDFHAITTANNLLTFTPLIEGDPASTTFTTGFYPQMTSLKLGVKIGF